MWRSSPMDGALLRLYWKSASARSCPCLVRLVSAVRQPSMSAIKRIIDEQGYGGSFTAPIPSACEKEPDFDQRYDHIGNELAQKVNAIENEIDRKSVVSGKSVSVGVDLGGRGIMKKTTNERTNRELKSN